MKKVFSILIAIAILILSYQIFANFAPQGDSPFIIPDAVVVTPDTDIIADEPPVGTEPVSNTEIIGKWEWVDIILSSDEGSVPVKPEAGVFTLRLDNDRSVSIGTDCNSFWGEYLIDENKVSFRDFASTLMYCEGSREEEYANYLQEVNSFFITDDDELALQLKYDTGSLIFERIDG